MRILHTSDWHIGRTFHGESTLDHLEAVLGALTEFVPEHGVDVVVIAGDIFDSAAPAAIAFDFLAAALQRLRAAGATVVVSSGNHDSAARLRFPSAWAKLADIHISADPALPATPIELRDEHGPVRCYPIPYLEPALVRHLPGADEVRTQEDALRWATDAVRADLAAHEGKRTLVLAHCFASGVPETTPGDDIERDLTAGGIDVVPSSLFDGFDYVALGHIHSRVEVTERIRYSGAPLHYSFSEAGAPRGAWLVDLDADGFAGAQWLELPVPRALTRLRGELDELLTDDAHAGVTGDWVQAQLTDVARPIDAMRRLRVRFPHAVHLEYDPPAPVEGAPSHLEQLAQQTSDEQRLRSFFEFIRGEAATEAELTELDELLAAARAKEAQR
ncbi:exonuclease SbcCD subunit D [Gulosibacter sp. ACHW.36C]|uniref:Nuclease SbcCD subunit D n=1 Tax=Gulosibacter sediminis TaxID=1729695 RepID=A0ABY4MW28_9MICO|nr:exonuclease SbcCD subunit D [Gulosibacter sediminis]UQN13915.1 exonuclease SbcCD subunit D [Gulosibacter sediminis]